MPSDDATVYIAGNRRRAHRLRGCASRGGSNPTETTWGAVKGEIRPCGICGKAMLMELAEGGTGDG